MSEEIQRGTPVIVTIAGTAERSDSAAVSIETAAGNFYRFGHSNPDVTVTPVDLERPTLDRETIRSAAQHAYITRRAEVDRYLAGDARDPGGPIWGHVADTIFELIQAAHPEWTP